MEDALRIGNISGDGKVSPNGKFYEFTLAVNPPKPREGQEQRYVTKFLRCSLFLGEEDTAPAFKKGQRVWVEGPEYRRDWKDEEKGTHGTELEVKVIRCGLMGGKTREIVEAEGEGAVGQASAPKKPQGPAKKAAGPKAKGTDKF